MSSELGHHEYAEALSAYVLGALPAHESDRVGLHITTCRECRAEVERLQVAADALPASVPQIDPPPSLKARVMGVVEAEAELLRAAGQRADLPEDRARKLPRWHRSPRWRPALALATVCAVAVIVVVLTTGGGLSRRRIDAAVTGREPQGASASLVLRGTHAELVVNHLRSPGAGHVQEVWVKHGSQPPRPAGTFTVTSGNVRVNRPVRSGDVVLVTAEPSPGSSRPTTPALLVARV